MYTQVILAILTSCALGNKPDAAVLTTNNGQPIDNDQAILTVGSDGPALLQDVQFIEKMAHFDRERIPERVVHAKGSGAHGYFEVTKDITHLTCAKIFTKIGKRTPVFTRFSTVGQSKGSSDTVRDPRGFSVKFYTEQGNWDLVSNNIPVFFIRDAMKFPELVHVVKPNPQTGLADANAFWDFMSLTPESINILTYLFSDVALPAGYPYMNGFGVHAYKLVKEDGSFNYVKFHWHTEQGLKHLTASEADNLAGTDKDHDRQQLFQTINEGIFPVWKLKVQIMTQIQALLIGPAALDATKIWSETDYPLQEVGRMVLNRNPDNFFAETEQSAFSPANIVPGLDFSEDKLLMGRLFSYGDSQRNRLGTNFAQIPINRPNITVNNYQRDGQMSIMGNYGSKPNYGPNSFGGPSQTGKSNIAKKLYTGFIGRFHQKVASDDFTQAKVLYNSYNEDEKDRLTTTIASFLKNAQENIRSRQLELFTKVDPDYSHRIQSKMQL